MLEHQHHRQFNTWQRVHRVVWVQMFRSVTRCNCRCNTDIEWVANRLQATSPVQASSTTLQLKSRSCSRNTKIPVPSSARNRTPCITMLTFRRWTAPPWGDRIATLTPTKVLDSQLWNILSIETNTSVLQWSPTSSHDLIKEIHFAQLCLLVGKKDKKSPLKSPESIAKNRLKFLSLQMRFFDALFLRSY